MNQTSDYQLIESETELAELCHRWQSEGFLAVDTEFVRTRTFYAKLGLFQVADSQGCYLIDPVAIKDLSSLVAVLENPKVIKVLHSGSEDAEIFHTALNAHCQSLYDTQIGAAYLGQGVSVGYANLVKQQLGIELPKDETRSDWLERPLSESQKSYAALDVIYLYQLFQQQRQELEQQHRFDWVLEDSNRLVEAGLPQDPETYYLKIRQAWQLKGPRLWVLKQLAIWREKLARQKDIPRSRILRDVLIFEIARSMPNNLAQLNKINGLYPGFIRRYGDEVLNIVASAEQLKREDYPERIPGPLKIEAGTVLQKAKALVAEQAEELSLPAELLARRKQLEALINAGLYTSEFELDRHFQGWRKEPVGEPLLSLLEEARQGE